MKRILVSLLIPISCCLSARGQNGDDGCSPKGNKETPAVNDPTKEQVGEATSWEIASYDPNEIIGPEGYDSVRWVSINDVLNYTILFENDPEFATAAAQKVDVRFDFPNKAWMKGFGIGGYSFSNMSWTVAKPSNAYQQRIDLKDSLGYYVDLIAGLDVARQQGFWTFTTIDPETGYAPWQAEMGLLPVNDSTHVGEGAVTFQLKPYEGLKTGDTISIQANIVFDQNDTIPTNRWCNKIDAGMPTSRIAPLSSPLGGTADSAYELTFTAKDDEGGSGVKHLLLYMANHNGIYEEIDTVSVDTVLVFPVEAGKQYKLYTIAVDNTGNREPAKMEPDVILNFNQAPTDIALSDTIFQDDLAAGGFIGKLTSVDSEDEKTFTYALAEGDGAIHNDLFQITDDQLQVKNSFKCADEDVYKIRISTTDNGGLSFSKSFVLHLQNVLEKPTPDTLAVTICEGETFLYHGIEYDKAGFHTYTQSNDYMCDSIYVLNLSVVPPLDMPLVTVEGTHTLVSSAAKGNQWFREDGTPVEGATEQKFTPTEDGIYYVAASNGSCYSAPSKLYRVRLSNHIDLQMDLAKGWNWISSNLQDAQWATAEQFVEPIAEQTYRIVGQTKELVNDPQFGLVGNLNRLSPLAGYKIQVTDAVKHTWQGEAYNPGTSPVQLNKGWNWIGYIPIEESTIGDALSGLTPSENDQLMFEDDFSVFSNGQWVGSLTTMQPGKGYIYWAAQECQLLFPTKKVYEIVENDAANARVMNLRRTAPWQYDEHLYPDNTTMIARLIVNGAPTIAGTYTVGAFCGDDCRGVGKFVDEKLFITVHGTIGDEQKISFRAYENATGQEYDISETVSFSGQCEGTMSSPFTLHVSNQTGIEGTTASIYTVYPRPLRNRLFVNGDTDNIKSIKVLAGDGAVSIVQNGYPADGIDVSTLLTGVYVVAIITNDGQVYYEKVMKASK